jgi:hypothetical protein
MLRHRSPLHLLHCADQAAELLWRDARASVTKRQLAVLVTVAADEGISQMDVTERTGIDRATVAEVVGAWSHKGFSSAAAAARTPAPACSS